MQKNDITPIELIGIIESYISYLYTQPGMLTDELEDAEDSLKGFADDLDKVKDMLAEEEYTTTIEDINRALRTLGFEPIKKSYR